MVHIMMIGTPVSQTAVSLGYDQHDDHGHDHVLAVGMGRHPTLTHIYRILGTHAWLLEIALASFTYHELETH